MDDLEKHLEFFYKELESDRARFDKYKGVNHQIIGVRINLLIGAVDLAEAAVRTKKRDLYNFGAKLSARAIILHMHEIIDSGKEFEFQVSQLSDAIGFDSNMYTNRVKEFNKNYKGEGLKDIRGMNKVRNIYGHSDPDWRKVIEIVDGIDVSKIVPLVALTINFRVLLIEWTSELINFLSARMFEMRNDYEALGGDKIKISKLINEKYSLLVALLNKEIPIKKTIREIGK